MAYTTIDDPEAYFQCKTYTGNYSTNAITLDGDSDLQGDLIWLKQRDDATDGWHCYDSVRGVAEQLRIDDNRAEATTAGILASFDTDGFTLGANNAVNQSSGSHVAWVWKAGGSAASATDGTIDTSRSVSTTAGFSIATYTGNATNGATRGHGLGVVPHLIIVKNRTDAVKWYVYHHKNTAAPETDYLELNASTATVDQAGWNDTAPTSTLVTTSDGSEVNASSKNYVMYSWVGIQGYSKFGSYIGNGNADGVFVYTGFRPAFLLAKCSSTTTGGAGNWYIFDGKRAGYNFANYSLKTNDTDAEATSTYLELLSNGFKIRNAAADLNGSGNTHIYMAFAEAPFVNSNGVPCNAR